MIHFIKESLLILIICSTIGYSQTKSFEEIAPIVKSTLAKKRNIQDLANGIKTTFSADEERIKATFVWLALNVKYDLESYKRGEIKDQSPEQVFANKKAVCQGYSEFFKYMCTQYGIKCELISGYSKGYGYRTGRKFKSTDHAWNAVKLNDKWILIDATWGSGYVNQDDDYVSDFNISFYDAAPQQFLVRHLPADPIWQLLPNPITLSTFEKDSNEIKKIILKGELPGNYLDTLSYFLKLDTNQQTLNSNFRIIRYNPSNGEAWYKISWYYYSNAWSMMSKLNDPIIQRDKSKSKPLANQAIENLNIALLYLNQLSKIDNSYKDEIRMKKDNIANNLKNLKEIAK